MGEWADLVAEWARRSGMGIAAAESLTGGMIASRLAAAPDASEWFRGAVVAYASSVKRAVLGVPPGPVVSEPAARAMALGALSVLGADVAVAVTGVGGPESQDGQPPGTVWIATAREGDCRARLYHVPGDGPAAICQATCELALRKLFETLM